MLKSVYTIFVDWTQMVFLKAINNSLFVLNYYILYILLYILYIIFKNYKLFVSFLKQILMRLKVD